MPKEPIQQRLKDLPLTKRDAEQLAEEFVLEQIGSTPAIGAIRETDSSFVIDIEVSYPRVIMDEATGEPRKTRFIELGKIGELVIDKFKGQVIDRPRYYDVQNAIREKMNFISESVEKALVRVAADQFSLLPFAVHLHTPVIDVLSWLLLRGSLQLHDLDIVPAEPAQKLISTLQPLEQVRLIDIRGETVVPGPILIGIEERFERTDKQLSAALAHYFREGYHFIDSIRQVLGPHLTLSSIMYERAVESEEPILLSLQQIEKDFNTFYRAERLLKLPRYLVQLEAIGVAEKEVRSGTTMWRGLPALYQNLRNEELLEPVGRMFA